MLQRLMGNGGSSPYPVTLQAEGHHTGNMRSVYSPGKPTGVLPAHCQQNLFKSDAAHQSPFVVYLIALTLSCRFKYPDAAIGSKLWSVLESILIDHAFLRQE